MSYFLLELGCGKKVFRLSSKRENQNVSIFYIPLWRCEGDMEISAAGDLEVWKFFPFFVGFREKKGIIIFPKGSIGFV